MGCPETNFRPGPCPACGKPESAIWGKFIFDGYQSVCSEACAVKLRDTLQANFDSPEYQKELRKLWRVQSRLEALKWRGLPENILPP